MKTIKANNLRSCRLIAGNDPGQKALPDYVHSKGLKLGIYSSPGPRTCGGFEGSYGHEDLDAKTWAAWGIGYLKFDWCSASRIWKDDDLRSMNAETRQILLNKEVIAVNQDRLGKAGYRVAKDGDTEVWAKPLDQGAQAVALFNRGPAEAAVSVKCSDLGARGPLNVRDLWAHTDRGKVADSFTAKVASHGVVLIRVWP